MSELPITLNGPGGQTYTGTVTVPGNPFGPGAAPGTTQIVPYNGGAQLVPVQLPNGQTVMARPEDVPALQQAYSQQQQQQPVRIGPANQTGPGGVLRAGADAAQMISGIMQRVNISERKQEIVSVIARMNKALQRLAPNGTVDPNQISVQAYNCLVAQRDAMITIFVHMDGLYSAALIQALGGGAALADDFGLFQGGGGMGGMGAGMGIAVGLGGGLLLSNLSAPSQQVDLTTIGTT